MEAPLRFLRPALLDVAWAPAGSRCLAANKHEKSPARPFSFGLSAGVTVVHAVGEVSRAAVRGNLDSRS